MPAHVTALVRAAGLCAAGLLAACASSTLQAPIAGVPGQDPCVLVSNPDPSRVYRVPRPQTRRDKPACNVTDRTISVYDQGQLRPTYGPLPTSPLLPTEAIDPVISRLKARAAALAPGQPLKVLIYVHGGLVEHNAAVAAAEDLAPEMAADGFEPVFLVWESSMARSYWDRLCCVRNGKIWLGGKAFFVPVRLAGDIGASVARAPENYGQEWLNFRGSTVGLKGSEFELRNDDEARLCTSALGQPAGAACLNLSYPPFDDSRINRLDQQLGLATVRHTVFFPVRVVGVATLPEVGSSAWANMIRRTRLALLYATAGPLRAADPGSAASCEALTRQADADVQAGRLPDKPNRPEARFEPIASGGFALFFERLDCEIRQHAFVGRDGRPVDLQLYFYGHSMGAIVGDEAIWRYPNLPWKRVVYMGAANSIRDFRTSTMPVLYCPGEPGRPPSSPCQHDIQFYSLMLHPLAEARELNLGGLPPQGSLLEWIDWMFGGPRTSDDRTFGKWTNVENTIQLFRPVARTRMHFRVFPSQGDLRDGDGAEQAVFYGECTAGPGMVFPKDAKPGDKDDRIDKSTKCHPVKHGEFTDYSFWRDAYLGPSR